MNPNSSTSRSEKTKQNTKWLAVWTIAWTLSMALATFPPKFIWDYAQTLSLLAIALNLLLGAGMIWANKRHMQGLDELQQKIQLEAMAITLGVGLVVGLAYSVLDTAQLIGQAEISQLVILQGLTYMGAVAFGQLRYR